MTLNENMKNFYIKMLRVGIPIVFQNLISLGLNLVDTLMIGMLGENELAAVGAANQVYFIFTVSLFGLYSGAAVFTAQFWGARDIKGVQKMLGFDYAVGFVFSIAVSALAFIFAPNIIDIFTDDSAVVDLGVSYIRIVSISYTFSAMTFAVAYNSRAIQNLVVPTTINACALGVNAILNYIFIFGKLGFPAMGVKGAAVATLTARILEFSAMMIFIYTRKEHPFKTNLRNLFGLNRAMFEKVMKTAMPVVMTECCWAVSVALIFAAYGMLGTSALAVAQVSNVISELTQSIYFGVGNATAMIIGEVLGQGNKDLAYRYGKSSIRIVMFLNVIMTIFMIAIASPVAGIYNFNASTTELLIKAIMVMGIMLTPRMLGYIYLVGILRAGGDTVFSMIVELVCNVLVNLPLAYFSVLVLRVDLPVAIMIVECGNIVRIIASHYRYKSKKWINIVTAD